MTEAIKKKKILIFSPTPSHPTTAGNRIRIYNLANFLQKKGYEIYFVYFTQEGLEKKQKEEMENKWNFFFAIKKQINYQKSSTEHYLIDDWYQDGIGETIRTLCLKHKIDVVLTNYIFQSKLLEFVPHNILKIIDTHDKFSNRHIMMKNNGLEPDFFYTTKEEESKGLNRADVIIAIQEKEKKFFETLTCRNIITVGHLDSKKYISKKYDRLKYLGFVGSKNSVNTKSIKQFIDVFIDYIDNNNINISLLIAGSVCENIDIKHPNIELKYKVDNLSLFYNNIDLIINPLTLGTGLKIKSIEAMSYGLPIVSTMIGSEGINTSSPYHLATNHHELMDRIEEIYLYPSLLNKLTNLSKNIFDKYISYTNNNLDSVLHINPPKSILIITHINFWELDLGSRMRLYYMLLYLKKQFNVTIAYTEKENKHDKEKLSRLNLEQNVVFLDNCKEKPVNKKKYTSFIKKFPSLKVFFDLSIFNKMNNFLENHQFDCTIVEYIHLSYMLPLINTSLTLLDTHDIMHIRNELYKKNNKKHWIDISANQEFAIMNEYDSCMCIQNQEYEYALHNNIQSILVPFSFNITKNKKISTRNNIIFIGGNNEANRDAIIWFIEKVWPFFKNTSLTLEIYGSVSHIFMNRIDKFKRQKIYPKGKINDLDVLYLQKADIAINPVKIGGGLKIKNIEALSYGVPLVTSKQGANGLEDGINHAFLMADTIDNWIESILGLMLSLDLRKCLSNNAIKYAEKKFSQQACYGGLVKYIKECAK